MVKITIGEALQHDGTLAPALGFEHEGTFITDPFATDCGRFEVNPLTHYRLTPAQLVTMAYAPDQKAFIVRAVLRGKREIIAAIVSGQIDPNVKTFGDLHDYCDANELGGLCEDAIADEGNRLFPERTDPDTIATQAFMDACNVIQDALNYWVEDQAHHVDEATESALNAGCKVIQDAQGVTDGGFAGMFFQGDARAIVYESFARYHWWQLGDALTD